MYGTGDGQGEILVDLLLGYEVDVSSTAVGLYTDSCFLIERSLIIDKRLCHQHIEMSEDRTEVEDPQGNTEESPAASDGEAEAPAADADAGGVEEEMPSASDDSSVSRIKSVSF